MRVSGLTPIGAPRRYNTWFFVAPAPEGEDGTHDDSELVASGWVRPADALAQHQAGAIDLIFPTEMSLRALARYEHAGDLLDDHDLATYQAKVDEARGLVQQAVDLLMPIVGAVLLATLIQGITSFSLTQLLSKEGQRLIAELRRKVQEHVGRLPVGYYDANTSGALPYPLPGSPSVGGSPHWNAGRG